MTYQRDRPRNHVEDTSATVNRRLFDTPAGAQTRARMEYLTDFPRTWEAFKLSVLARFDLINPSQVARDKLKSLRQIASVQEYTRRFLALVAEVDDMNEAEKTDRYFDGLRLDVQKIIAVQGLQEDFPAMVAAAERIDALQYRQRLREGKQGEGKFQRKGPEANRLDKDYRREYNKDRKPYNPNIICYRCNQKGHISRGCTNPPVNKPGQNRQQGNGTPQ